MNGFERPNTTPTPNNLFDKYLPVLGDAELRVLLAIIRETLGWEDKTTQSGRRERTTLPIQRIMKMTGLSENGVRKGAQAAIKRGLLKRINHPHSRTTSAARWELVWTDATPSHSEGGKPPSLTRRGRTPSPSEGKLPHRVRDLKERKKEINSGDVDEILLFYEEIFGKTSKAMRKKIVEAIEQYSGEWVTDALNLTLTNGGKSWAYTEAILENWQKNGKSNNKRGAQQPKKKLERNQVVL